MAKLVTFELRPRLGSCNVFIFVSKNINFGNLCIRLSETDVVLSKEGSVVKLVLPTTKLIPTSLSTLRVISNCICFRVQTKPVNSTLGSVKTEICTYLKPADSAAQGILHDDWLSVLKSESTFCCACCKNTLSYRTVFKRVLPYPDINYDLSEWYCCKQYDSNQGDVLSPNEVDYFYGPFFSILHKNVFRDCLIKDKDSIFCNRCLSCIGHIHMLSSFKVWNCCVDIKLEKSLLIKTASDPFMDFIRIIKYSIIDILGSVIILQSSMGDQMHCVTIKPMDWQLCVLTGGERLKNIDTIQLKEEQVIKVLYNYDTYQSVTNNSFINVRYYEVSLSILEAGLKHLLATTQQFPHHYRSTNNYYIGHINTKLLKEIHTANV